MLSRRNPNKADISRDIRVAAAPEKRREQIEFEEDLAYIKTISIPLAERKARRNPDRLLAFICFGCAALIVIILAALAPPSRHALQERQRSGNLAACIRINDTRQFQREYLHKAFLAHHGRQRTYLRLAMVDCRKAVR